MNPLKTRHLAGRLWLAILLGAGTLAPGAAAPPDETRPAQDEAADPHISHGVLNFSVSWSAPERVVVPMKMRNGLPTVRGMVNGQPVWMILDTGSEECVLEAETARTAGVHMIARALAHVEVTGVRGQEIDRVGVPDSIAIGAWHWQGLPCVVRTSNGEATGPRRPSTPTISFNILGMSALRAMCSFVTIDYGRHEVVFGFKQPFQPVAPATATRQAVEMRHGLPYAKVAHGPHEWTALLDTGASSRMEINQATAERCELRKHSRWVNATRVGLGESNGPQPRKFEYLILGSVTCLGRSWRTVEAVLVENESKIGSGMGQAFRLTLDFAGSQIWLEPPGPREP